MKKHSIIIGIIGIILVCVITTGCIFYNLVDAKEFKSHFEDLGYTITSNKDDDYNSTTYYAASKEDSTYDIEYYEFKDETDAKKAYQNFKENISNFITSEAKNQETTGAVFSKIVSVSEKEYLVFSRVKNTLIVIKGTNDVSDEINSLLEEIRY